MSSGHASEGSGLLGLSDGRHAVVEGEWVVVVLVQWIGTARVLHLVCEGLAGLDRVDVVERVWSGEFAAGVGADDARHAVALSPVVVSLEEGLVALLSVVVHVLLLLNSVRSPLSERRMLLGGWTGGLASIGDALPEASVVEYLTLACSSVLEANKVGLLGRELGAIGCLWSAFGDVDGVTQDLEGLVSESTFGGAHSGGRRDALGVVGEVGALLR